MTEEREMQLLYILGYKEKGLRPGSFYGALLEAALRADRANLGKMYGSFPNTALAVAQWQNGDLGKKYDISYKEKETK